MKREIKFRAWIPKLKRIIYIGSHKNDTAVWICEDGFNVVDHFTGVHESMGTDEDGVILMQYTGLKDKNGKDVYEGDIIKWPIGHNDYATLIMYVGYNELGMRLYKRLPCECCGGHKGGSIPSFGIFKKCEVIGNIYENSELLKA